MVFFFFFFFFFSFLISWEVFWEEMYGWHWIFVMDAFWNCIWSYIWWINLLGTPFFGVIVNLRCSGPSTLLHQLIIIFLTWNQSTNTSSWTSYILRCHMKTLPLMRLTLGLFSIAFLKLIIDSDFVGWLGFHCDVIGYFCILMI